MTDNHLLLYRLAELMLEQEQHVLPVDLLFDDEKIVDFVKSIQIDSPYQQMLLEGVLTESVRDEKLYVSFTVEGYFHYVLGEVIYNRTKGLGAEVLKQIIEENKLNGLKEGIEHCLIRDVDKYDLRRLLWMIDNCGNHLELFTTALSCSFLKFGNNPIGSQFINLKVYIKKIIKLLIANRTSNDIELLENVIDFLELKSKNIIAKEVCNVLINEIQLNDSKSAILILKALKYKEHKFKIQYSKKLVDFQINEVNKERAYFFFYRANLLSDIYKKELALRDFVSCISILKKLKGNYCKDIKACYNNIALIKCDLGDFKGALNNLKYETKVKKLDSDYINFHNLGNVYFKMGNYNKAIENFKKSLEIKVKLFGLYDDQVQLTYNNLGVTYDGLGDFEMAEYYFNQSLNISYKIYGEHHDSTATSLHNLAGIKINQDNIDEAIEYYKKALKIRISIFGENHEKTANTYQHFSSVFIGTNEYKKTYSLLKKSQKINENVFGKNAPQNIDCLNDIAIYYWNIGDFKKSLSFFETTKNICKKHFGERHPKIETAFNNLAVLYEETGDNVLALKYHRKTILLCKNLFGVNHPKLATSFNNIGLYYKKQRRYKLAEKYYNKSLTIRTKVFGDRHSKTATIYNNLGVLLSDQDKYELAIMHHLKALEIRENIFGESHDDTCSSLNNLAICYFGVGNYMMASEMITRAYFGLSKLHRNNHPKVLGCARNCSIILQKANKHKEAIHFLEIELKAQGKENITNQTKIQNLNFEIANCFMEIKEFELAIEKLNKLFEIIPDLKYVKKLARCYESIDDIDSSIDYRIKSIELMINIDKYDKGKLIAYIIECISFAKKNKKLNHLPSWIIDLSNDNK
jgi:tetratricopeptide (TPR) repeat protein